MEQINDLTKLRDHSILTVAQWLTSYCRDTGATIEEARAQIPHLIRKGVLEIVPQSEA